MTSIPVSEDSVGPKTPVVLITRPEGQQHAFARGCTKLGYSVTLLPCLQILPCTTDRKHLLTLLDTHDTVLFTSANAVRFAHAIVPFPWPVSHVHAIGAATAKTLQQYKQRLTLVPQPPFNSEAYLAQLADKTPGSLLIVKGQGGRELIQSSLTARGWRISSLAVYERSLPNIPSTTIDALFDSNTPDIISVTSDETLTNLWKLCHHHTEKLQLIPLVVNSQRCAQLATSLGFRCTALVASPAGDQGQIACLASWKKTVFDVI